MDLSVLDLGLATLRRARSAAERNVELLEGIDAIAERVQDVGDRCATSLHSVMRPEPLCSPTQPYFDRLIGRGVGIDAIWHREGGYLPDADDTHYAARVGRTLPIERLMIYDRGTAFAAVPGIPVAEGALFIHGADLMRPYLRLFDRIRDDATPVHSADVRFTPQQRRVLALLREGCRDAEIAGALGVSDRTVRRQLRALHLLTGTRTRFQLGEWVGSAGRTSDGQPK